LTDENAAEEGMQMVLKKGALSGLESFKGSLAGCAVGDALGSTFEGTHGSELGYEPSFSGRWTDDTHMMIGVAESLIENEGFDGTRMALTFMKHYHEEPWRGYASGPPQVFGWIESGVSWREASKRLFGGVGSLGNGAAMRVAPIGLLYFDDPQALRSVACDSSQITHAHELGKEGAAIEAYSVALAVKGALSSHQNGIDTEEFLVELRKFTHSDIYLHKLDKIGELLSHASKSRVQREIGNGVEASNSVPTAIYCFLHNLSDFKESLLYAVSLGGDTDTIAAMTGAISGAYHGFEAIPEQWRSRLEQKDYIESLAEKLWNMKAREMAK
jgi:poly(ADP-ribose) glycohydrolase ARH3